MKRIQAIVLVLVLSVSLGWCTVTVAGAEDAVSDDNMIKTVFKTFYGESRRIIIDSDTGGDDGFRFRLHHRGLPAHQRSRLTKDNNCEVPEGLRERSDMLILTFLDENWRVVASIWPDVRRQSFLYALQAGDYQIKLDAPGKDEAESVTWLMAGDNWVCLNEDTPLPDDILFTYQEDCVYELPTEGLA